MTWTGRRFLAAIGLAGAFALGGCAYDDGYYGGVSVGSGYYGGGYYDDYWGPGSYYPGYYSGWYNGFYYPGSGYYVYDRGGRRHRWNDGQRRYWEGRRGNDRPAWSTRQGQGQWQGSQGQGQWQGNRENWRGRWRDGGANSAPTNPPAAQSQPGTTSPRGAWSTRSDGGRMRGGDGSRGDGRRSWRR